MAIVGGIEAGVVPVVHSEGPEIVSESNERDLEEENQPCSEPEVPNLAQEALERLASCCSKYVDNKSDFQPAKKRKISLEQPGNSDDGQTCIICLEPWSNSGGHRLASLSCGHLFGYNCIEKWLKAQSVGRCPQCNARARKKDVRMIYAKSISVVDTTERDRALKEVETVRAQLIAAQKSEAQAILQNQLVKAECERLRQEILSLREQLEYFSKGKLCGSEPTALKEVNQLNREGRFISCKDITLSQSGSARVMAWDPLMGMMAASRPSNNQLLPGYGLMKMSTLELSCSEYVPVHSQAIRDVVFSPRGDSTVLTAGMDRTMRLTSMTSNSIVQRYETPASAWACAWDRDDHNYLYGGLQNGAVLLFDVRNTSGPVRELRRAGLGGGACPVTSVAHVPVSRVSTLNCSGLLVGALNGCVFWEKSFSGEEFTPHSLGALPEGSCTCVSFEPATRHFLASFRPSKRCPNTRHILFQLHNTPLDKPFSCQLIHQFSGGTTQKLLSRSKLFLRPGNDGRLLAAFGDEDSHSMQIWDISSTSRLQCVPTQSPMMDALPFTAKDKDMLAVLNEFKVLFHQWNTTTD